MCRIKYNSLVFSGLRATLLLPVCKVRDVPTQNKTLIFEVADLALNLPRFTISISAYNSSVTVGEIMARELVERLCM